jgi:hypothetical protein
MTEYKRDTGLDALLDLHSQIMVVDEKAGYWVKFVVRRVPPSDDKPHGLDYSLTLHDATGERLVGFDNAHPVKGSKGRLRDHRHRFKTVKPYAYRNAAALLEDFWSEVDMVLKEKGIII